MNYNGPKLVVEQFVEFDISKDSRILDMAAGTGLVGVRLRENGYTNIDALDGSAEMLIMAKKRQCYEKIITHFIRRDTKLPIEDHTYDHIIMAGGLCHIDYETLPQIIRTCKPGKTSLIINFDQINYNLEMNYRRYYFLGHRKIRGSDTQRAEIQ